MLKKLRAQNITILVSTPYMDEAILCNRIALIQKGTLLKIDKPQAIVDEFPHELWAVSSHNMSKLLTDLREIPSIRSSFAFGASHHITIKNNQFKPDDLYDNLLKKGHSEIEIKKEEATIEDCFMDLSLNQ